MSKKAIIITGLGLAAVTAGVLIYRSKRNEAEGQALLAFINESVDQTNATKAATDQISKLGRFKVDPNRVRIGKLSGKLTDPAVRSLMAKTNVGIASAMRGAGTDQKSFLQAMANVKSKNTLALLDQVFKAQYKEGLFQMMQGETKFFNKEYCQMSEKTSSMLNQLFPMFAQGCWVPWLATWMAGLPDY